MNAAPEKNQASGFAAVRAVVNSDVVLSEESGPVKEPWAFIPIWLDDLRLNLNEFRLYSRISRRGDRGKKMRNGPCFESVTSMAKGCRMKNDTVRKTLKTLLSKGLITAEVRPGKETIYRLTPPPMATDPSPNGHQRLPSNGEPIGTNGMGLAGPSTFPFSKEKPPEQTFESECWQYQGEAKLPTAYVQSFIVQHRRDGWTIRGKPIENVRGALWSWCETIKLKAKERRAQTDQATNDANHTGTDFAWDCYSLANQHDLDCDAVGIFINQHERDGGTAVNKATGEREPIRDLAKTLISFCQKYESDREGF